MDTSPTRSGSSSRRSPAKSAGRRSSTGRHTSHGGARKSMPRSSIKDAPAKSTHKRNEDAVRLVPLGGLEEVGRNCAFLEYKNEIVIIDAGLQFPEEATPGVDYIIPNLEYLEKKKGNIVAIILTHGHYDHIGALPYMVSRLGNPTVYATSLTKAIVEKRHEDFPNAPKLKIQTVKNWDHFKLSPNFEATFFGVAHTIPETAGVVIGTPIGNVVHFADFRIDYDLKDNPQGIDEFEKVAKMGIHTFMIDSTNAEEEGHTLSERLVEKNLEDLFKKAEGRIIIATFASLIDRIAEIIKIAERQGRKVAISGYSMKSNVQISQNLGFIKAKPDTIISPEEIRKYPDNKILVLSTGAQGESNASLMKIINGEHRHVQIKKGDMVVFSSSVIPGNERSVQMLRDNLSRQGAVVYNSKMIDIHASGHAPKDDLQLVVKTVKPKFVMPVHGYYFMRNTNANHAKELGYKDEQCILMDNGQVAELTADTFKITDEKVPSYYVVVDGLGVGDVEEVVLRDRMALSQEGMVVTILVIDRKKARLIKSPDIISRGFIYLKENQEVLDEIRKKIRGLLSRIPQHQPLDPDYVKTMVRDQVGQYLYQKTRRRPMVLPVIIEI